MKKLSLAVGCMSLLVGLAPAYAADAAKGKEAFENNCSICHNADSTEAKIGPGLKGLYKKAAMNNKKKPSDATVTAMINEGGNGMPGFADQLTPAEKLDLVAYLKTL
jgi:cytochrome c